MITRQKNKKFYLTTPIYYVNDQPHIGHAYTTIVADILARWQRMQGKDVFFLTGTDENSQKNVEAAMLGKARGKEPITDIVQQYVNQMSAVWQRTWDDLDLTYNDFIRTTEERHKKAVKKFFELVYKKGDIYKGKYQGLYCIGCEAFMSETDLIDGKCPDHQKPPRKISEENYFFRLSKYRDALLEHIGKNPDFIQPESRRNEIVSYIKGPMADFSISRQTMEWGIPAPSCAADKERGPSTLRQGSGQASLRTHPSTSLGAGAKHQVLYVWFDALISYLTGIGFGWDEKKFKKYWPADLHLLGKDIIKFHAAYWPAMLMSAGLALPKKLFVHGYFTINGQKMSKTLRNVIAPSAIVQQYGLDALRYFLATTMPFGNDGDFSEQRLRAKYDSDLAHGIGNLAARVFTMAEKYLKNKAPAVVEGRVAPYWRKYEKAMENLQFDAAAGTIWELIKFCDGYIDREQPWVLAKINKEQLAIVLYTLLESLRHIALMLMPFMPETAEKIFVALGQKKIRQVSLSISQQWGGLKSGAQLRKIQPLFPLLK